MPRHVEVLALFLFLGPRAVSAQVQAHPVGVTLTSSVASFSTDLCDGTEMRAAELRRPIGNVLIIGGAAIGLLGSATNGGHTGRIVNSFAIGAGLALAGGYLRWSAVPAEDFWQRIVGAARVGETREEDVRSCLHAPQAMVTSASAEEWTYFLRRPPLGNQGTYRAVSFSFRDSVLVDVRRTQVTPRPEDSPPLIVPVPVPGNPR